MIVVLVAHMKPVEVLRTTREEFVRRVRSVGESGQYLATWPPVASLGEFEASWQKFTRDLKHARHFPDAGAALAHYEAQRGGLTLAEHARILGALRDLVATTAPGLSPSGDAPERRRS
ncbi:MAG: hypothetical protein KGL36_06835 [Gammaproteobacteria bacterium]|nr:hypothetical protein [Gammaproteobacteria bacterium]